MNFVRMLAGAVKSDENEEATDATLRAATKRDLGWTLESDFHRDVLDHLQPVGAAIAQCMRDKEADAAAIQSTLETFETWYEAAYHESFYVQFDQEPPHVNLVEI
jgi:hypothetical protein